MKHETEKLAEALKAWDGVTMHGEEWDAFQNKYNENPCTVIVNTARRYAEVLPLLNESKVTTEDIVESVRADVDDMSERESDFVRLGVIRLARKIAAIVARDEERKSDE